MTIEDDIRAWALERPGWQQDVLVALARGGTFESEQIEALADRLLLPDSKNPNGAATDIALGGTTPKQVRLSRVYNLKGVNALAEDQELPFASDGLTIIYGNNGSGKSGYARLVKGMVSARHSSTVLPDVFRANAPDPSAEIAYQVDDTEASEKFPAAKPIEDLQQVRFYDEHCGDEYLAHESTITYRPSALVLLSELIAVCGMVRQELQARLTDSEQQALHLPIPPETPAGAFLAQLSEKTTDADIEQATTLPPTAKDDLGSVLQEVARLEASDADKERTRLQGDAAQVERLQTKLTALTNAVSSDRLDAIQKLQNDATAKRAAAALAATNTFEKEPLDGVGSRTWRALWEAARAFATTEVDHEHAFPQTGNGARCVLCHQPLDEAARDRFERFNQYMIDTTQRDADAAERLYTQALNALRSQDFATQQTTTALARVLAHEPELARTVQARMSALEARRDEAVAYFEGSRPDVTALVTSDDVDKLTSLAATLDDKAAATDVAGFRVALATVHKRQGELKASAALSESADALKAEVARLKAHRALGAAKQQTITTGITSTTRALTDQYATERILDHFTRETEGLKLRRVTLKGRGGSKGKVSQIPGLVDVHNRNVKTPEVLSEGEQTVLGLAGFFTEAEFDESKSALVLDDPVTSLDHIRREKVANRLVELAQSRQIIIFTHDVSFVSDLLRAANTKGVAHAERSIELRGDKTPGLCIDEFPWNAKDFKGRLAWLRDELTLIKKERPGLSYSEYEARAADWAGYLSTTWERVVTVDVLNQVFDRGASELRPSMFRIFADISPHDNTEFQDGYGYTSTWGRRHDNADVKNYVAPEPDELEREFNRIRDWQKRISGYRQKK
ncbi:AAA family ATPase [Promicromonospora sp. NPDC059942]|uniref:AAA family ATPase n=1 Tax=Promicromonospora sp. NPDC059942 TaxID=3347009 RepID=UPI0036558D60